MLPETRHSLIARLPQGGDEDWADFEKIYKPAVYGYLKKRGLQDADADEVVQDVFLHLSRQESYDPQVRFRSILFTVTKRRMIDFFRKQKRTIRGSGETWVRDRIEQIEAQPEIDWELEYQQHLLSVATAKVKDEYLSRNNESAFCAYEETQIKERKAKEVAKELELTPAAVRMGCTRIRKRIRECIDELECEADARFRAM